MKQKPSKLRALPPYPHLLPPVTVDLLSMHVATYFLHSLLYSLPIYWCEVFLFDYHNTIIGQLIVKIKSLTFGNFVHYRQILPYTTLLWETEP